MKKMMMMAVMGLVGTAGAADNVTGNVKFEAKVSNVCQVGLGANFINLPGGSQDIMGAPSPILYDASMNPGPSATASTAANNMSIRCTKGTPLKVSLTPDGGTAKPNLTAAGASESGAMTLKSTSNVILNGTYTFSMTMTNGGNGDMYSGTAKYTVTAGQWNAPADTYKGTLVVRIEYN